MPGQAGVKFCESVEIAVCQIFKVRETSQPPAIVVRDRLPNRSDHVPFVFKVVRAEDGESQEVALWGFLCSVGKGEVSHRPAFDEVKIKVKGGTSLLVEVAKDYCEVKVWKEMMQGKLHVLRKLGFEACAQCPERVQDIDIVDMFKLARSGAIAVMEPTEGLTQETGRAPSKVFPGVVSKQKARPSSKPEGSKDIPESTSSSDLPNFGGSDDQPPLGSSRESKSNKITNMQNLKNQVPAFLEYSGPRPFDDVRFIKAEGAIDWVKGVPPMEGTAKSLRVSEQLPLCCRGMRIPIRMTLTMEVQANTYRRRKLPISSPVSRCLGELGLAIFLMKRTITLVLMAIEIARSQLMRSTASVRDSHFGSAMSFWVVDIALRQIAGDGFQLMTSSTRIDSGKAFTSS